MANRNLIFIIFMFCNFYDLPFYDIFIILQIDNFDAIDIFAITLH